MSFPRAKIQRFNDVMNSVPSPTKYDPKLSDKVIGGCILKGETKPSAFSDTASASSSKSNHTPVFRTPQLPKKHNCLGVEKGSHSAFKSISLKSDDIEFLSNEGEIEELKSLRVECTNKSETINDLEKHVQDLKTQLCNHEKSKEKLEAYILELDNIILGLEMELESRVRNTQELKETNEALLNKVDEIKAAMEEEKLTFKCKLSEITENAEIKIKELNAKIVEQDTLTKDVKKDFEAKKLALIKNHMEEVLQLQNEYESKLLAQMQDNAEKINNFQCQLDEKENCLKQANLKYVKACSEWEKKFQESESNFSNLISNLKSEHLEAIEETKKIHLKKFRLLETNSSKTIDEKNVELDLLTTQYREILHEVNILLSDLEKKNEEINSFQENNKNLNSRLKLMLEEIKILSKENEEQIMKLDKMTTKYNQEFNKNEQLSCKLGERDTEILHLKDDLCRKTKEWQNLFEELKRSNNLCDKLQIKKCDLESTIVELQDKSNHLLKDLNERKAIHKEEIKSLKQELADVKSQCRKFEIITGNTGKSLEALRQRLIESENEVVKLGKENSTLKIELMEANKIKSEYQNEVEILRETKLDLETTLDENLSINKNLLQKCANLELLSNDLEFRVNSLAKTNEELEREKQKHIQIMNELIKKQELQLIETERASLNQIEQISQTLSEKLEFFMKFSTEKVQNLTTEIKNFKSENEKLKNDLISKTEDFDNLFTDHEILKTTVDISVKEIETLKKRCEDQSTELNEKEKLSKDLICEKEKIEQNLSEKLKEHFKVVEECENLHREIEEKEIELKRLDNFTNDLTDQVNNLESEIINLEAIINDKTEKLRNQESEILTLGNKIQEKNEELVTCQKEKSMCIQDVQTLNREKEDLITSMRLLKKKLEDTEELAEDLRKDKQLAEEKCRKQKLELTEFSIVRSNLESEVLFFKREIEDLKEKGTSLEEIENRKNYYKNNCLKLDKLCQELTEENTSLKNDFNEIHSVLQVKDKKIEDLEKRSSDLESLIGPFREQLERYETERLLIENDREQLRKQHLEQAAELGHRNHKQKIQHVVNLKNTLLQTRKENEKLTLEIKNLKKKMQKLQEELGHDPKRLFIGGRRPSTTPFKGKENSTLLNPAAGFYQPMAVKQEPMSPSSPLRNRNQ